MEPVRNGRSAIDYAEKYDYPRLLQALQTRPASAKDQDDFGMTPLHWICSDAKVPLDVLQKVVLAHPPATSTKNLAGLLPLHIGVRKNLPLEGLKTLLKYYPRAILTTTPDGKSVLELAKETIKSRSALIFLHMLDAEVRALSPGPKPSPIGTAMSDAGPEHPGSDEESMAVVAPLEDPALTSTTTPLVLPPRWKLDKKCYVCQAKFGYFKNRHHCRNCGGSVCSRHSKHFIPLKHFGLYQPQRVCTHCYDKHQNEYSARALRSSPQHRRPVSHTTLGVSQPPTFAPATSFKVERSISAREYQQIDRGRHPLISPRTNYTMLEPSRSSSRPLMSPRPSFAALVSPRVDLGSGSSQRQFDDGPSTSRYNFSAIRPNFTMFQSTSAVQMTRSMKVEDNNAAEETSISNNGSASTRRRLAKTEFDAPSNQLEFSPVEAIDSHVNDLEAHVQQLLIAKKQIGEALKHSRMQIETARLEKKKIEEMSKEYEAREHSPSNESPNLSGYDADDALSCADMTESERTATVIEDNQETHDERDLSEGGDFVASRKTVRVSPLGPEPSELDVPVDLASTHFDMGMALIGKGDVTSAVIAFKKSLGVNDEDPVVWYNLAKALETKGDLEDAESAVKKSLDLEPNSLTSLSLLGKLLHARGEHDEAIVVFRQALSLQSNSSRPVEGESP
ncbi:TPA: hypothetical protein N0F65_004534 [Lagenidium giganteum]|uniref:FYVE-type domain-containing protein n=1 Tax=Lagenidium giganteum TaxID=4803 RepID=A0AAV2YXN1_9STRA|nr:TPA: hypothetical protein N0F65_004534 [Lagenidium giganteum]